MKKRKVSSTLIELLIVSAILSVVSLAIYGFLNSGLKIWQRINLALPEEDWDIFLNKFTRDLRNTVKFSKIGFLGKTDRLTFATIVNSQRLEKKTIGQVTYEYDPMAKTLSRMELDFSELSSGAGERPVQPIGSLGSFKFQYYIYDKDFQQYTWLDECPKGIIPLAVRINLEISHGKETRELVRTVSIPVGK